MERVLDQWVCGQGKKMRKNSDEGRSAKADKVKKARKAVISRMITKVRSTSSFRCDGEPNTKNIF
jgi:hypothetical protein